ncbi:acyl coA binding protein [Ditylenchus destructor]|nr:acyl coA binding protein [Ditylenchus destructor]
MANGESALANTVIEMAEEASKWTPEGIDSLFGCTLDRLYKDAIKFYKEKERLGELQLEYPARLQFMAYFKQKKYGTFKEEAADCGWFDLVGNDVRKEWKKLGDLSPDAAMLEFVRLLDAVCPTFRPHIKEQRALEAPKIVLGEAKVNRLGQCLVNGTDSKEILQKYQQQRQQIQEALNKQTYHQFLAYAQQTHPGEPDKVGDTVN